jgi:uncharacterized protein YcbX
LTDPVNEVRVTGITIYPIKSTAGIVVDSSAVEPQGLAHDRRWMVVDEFGECQTGREWDDECRAQSAGAAVDEWFSSLLAARSHLVYMGDASQRPVEFEYSRPGDRVSFADAYPLLLISEASLEDLNGRLREEVSMRRFRPNIVVAGCDAYDEDDWRNIRIGEMPFDGAKNCARCVFTTIDPDTGQQHPQLEPLRTLGGYRRGASGGVLFGRNLIPRGSGTVSVGDVVSVTDDA